MNLISLFRQISPYVRPYRWLVLMTLLFTLIGSFAAQVNAIVLQYTVDEVNKLVEAGKGMLEGSGILVMIAAILLGKEILSSLITFCQKYFGEKLRILVSRDLAQSVIEKMLTYRLAFYTASGNEPGKLQTRIDRGVASITETVKNFFIDILPLFTSAVMALFLMFRQNFWVGLVALLIVPVYFWITYREAVRLKGWRRDMRDFRELKSHGIMNIIESITVIKSFNREQLEARKQLEIQDALTENQMSTRKVSYVFDGLKSFVEQIGTVLIIILTVFLVLSGLMSIGAIMYHIMLFNNVSAPIRQLHRIYDTLNDALIYSESFFGIMNAEEEVEESGSYRPEQIRGDFQILKVDFSYPNGTKALKGVDLEIKNGQTTALVGLSGAGKSTIVNLLDKFYLPTSGQILLDGHDIREYDTHYLRDHIGLVLQKNHIFSGTIEENIRYGNQSATHEQVVEAARKAFILDQIQGLPRGFESQATELSGGQQQRIAIARMFLKNPPIIFLDEPTASLDAIATEQIKNSLDAIKKDRTVIIISHSISQIIDADDIYTLEKGCVMEHGTHDTLYHRGGVYHDIFSASARSLNIEKIAKTLD